MSISFDAAYWHSLMSCFSQLCSTVDVLALRLLTGISYLLNNDTTNQASWSTRHHLRFHLGVLPSLGAVVLPGIFISTQLVAATVFGTFGAFAFNVVPVISSNFLAWFLQSLLRPPFNIKRYSRLARTSQCTESQLFGFSLTKIRPVKKVFIQ